MSMAGDAVWTLRWLEVTCRHYGGRCDCLECMVFDRLKKMPCASCGKPLLPERPLPSGGWEGERPGYSYMGDGSHFRHVRCSV